MAKNPRSAIAVGQAQALAFLACAGRGIPIHSYPPTQVKGAVAGYGRGEKEQVQEMVRLQLGLEEAPGPDAAPFVSEGDLIKEGQVLCIIEAMKLMNEIESKLTGRVAKVLVENGQPVEFGQPLFLVEPRR